MTEQEIQEKIKAGIAAEMARLRRRRLQFWALVGLLIPLSFLAATIVKPHTFNDGDVLSAAKLNENFDALYTKVNELDAKLNAADEVVCLAASDSNVPNTLNCSSGKKFVTPVFGGKFYDSTYANCNNVQASGINPMPNLRIDDDSNAVANQSYHIVYWGCIGQSSCTFSAIEPGTAVFIGTCR